jgi:hypothetical protein
LPNGRQRSVRRSQTDLSTPLPEDPQAGSSILRVDVRTLLTLMHHLRSTLAIPAEEVIRDEKAPNCASHSVPSSRTTAGSSKTAASLAEFAGGQRKSVGPCCRGAAVADAPVRQPDKGEPLC